MQNLFVWWGEGVIDVNGISYVNEYYYAILKYIQ